MYYIICIVCCVKPRFTFILNYRLTWSLVPLHYMFHKNGVQPFSDVPVNVWQGVWKLLWKPNNCRRFFRWFLLTCHRSANTTWNNKEAGVQRRKQNQDGIYWFWFKRRIAKLWASSTALSLNTFSLFPSLFGLLLATRLVFPFDSFLCACPALFQCQSTIHGWWLCLCVCMCVPLCECKHMVCPKWAIGLKLINDRHLSPFSSCKHTCTHIGLLVSVTAVLQLWLCWSIVNKCRALLLVC